MANVEIMLDSAGVQALLKSAEVAAVCEKEAARMTQATGMEYVSDVFIGKTRVNASAYQDKGGDKE